MLGKSDNRDYYSHLSEIPESALTFAMRQSISPVAILPSLVVSSALLSLAIAPASVAQVVPDNTVPTMVINPLGQNFLIQGGARSGEHLFHSFSQFSVPTGGSATFNPDPAIRTIFSRVTGNTPSQINGLLQTTGSASLFLLNPNGIILGDQAVLNIAGSFVATTAERVKFADGTEFAAVNTPPLLTMSAPIGLQMGSQSNAIQWFGRGNQEIVPTQDLGLVSRPGQSFVLLGNGINSTGGVVTAPTGRIEVGSVGSGLVQLQPTPSGWQLGYQGIADFRDIRFSQGAALWNPYPVGNPFGGIQVAGRQIQVERSLIAAAALADHPSQGIHILAQDSLTLSGYAPTSLAPVAQILNRAIPGSTGDAGGITIQAGQIRVTEGGAIETDTFGAGRSGDIQVRAGAIALAGYTRNTAAPSPAVSHSRISTVTYGAGRGGDIQVQAPQIDLQASGRIITRSLGLNPASGRGGDITVSSETITASGIEPLGFGASGLSTLSVGTGDSGNLKVFTNSLQIRDGALVWSFAYRLPGLPLSGFGNAGSVEVFARDRIEVIGASPLSPIQAAALGSATTGSGNGGDVRVKTRDLIVRDGGSVTAGTAAVLARFGDPTQSNRLGNGGNLVVEAENIELTGINPWLKSGSSVGTYTLGNGNAGNAWINADRIAVQDGAFMVSSTGSTGDAGALRIQARDILVSGSAGGSDAAILSSGELLDPAARIAFGVPDRPSGNTGTLSITANQITLRDRGKIGTQHDGLGNAGNLEIRTQGLSLQNRAQVTATSLTGMGGDIDIQVENVLLMRDGSKISAESFGAGDGGNIKLQANLIVGVNDSDIIANAIRGNGGNIQLSAQSLIGIQPRPKLTDASDITASSQLGLSGTISVNNLAIDLNSALLNLPTDIIDPTNQISQDCSPTASGSFVMTGKGGTPTSPLDVTALGQPWIDVRPASSQLSQPKASPLRAPLSQIPEATGWRLDAQGQVELEISLSPNQPNAARGINCLKIEKN